MGESRRYRAGRKRVMKDFEIDEVSGVDFPAQEPALVAIIKQRGGFPQPRRGESRSAFVSRMLEDPEKRREFDSREQIIAVANSVFERARARKEHDVNKQRPRDGESESDFVARMMRDEDMDRDAARRAFRRMRKAGDLVEVLSESAEGHQHGISIYSGMDGVSIRVSYAAGPDGEMHDHQVVRDAEGGRYVMSENRGHTHGIDQERMTQALIKLMNKAASDPAFDDHPMTLGGMLVESLPEVRKALYAPQPDPVPAPVPAPTPTPVQKERPVSDDDLTKERDALKAKSDRLAAIVALNATHRSHFDSLEKAAQDQFLAMTVIQRDDELAKANSADPIEYTDMDGNEYRKSVGELAIRQARQMDTLRKELKASQDRERDAELTKAAEALPHLPGDLEARKALVKAVSGIADAGQRDKALEALKAHDSGLADVFKSKGHLDGTVTKAIANRRDAEERMEELTKQLQEKEGIDYSTAYERVEKSHPDVYAKAIGA